MAGTFKLKLIQSHMMSDDCRHLIFSRDDQQALEFRAGQFIQIHFEYQGIPLKRSYSVASSPEEDYIEIAVSYVEGGAATRLLSELKPGETVDASGPYGRFYLEDNHPERYLFFATGTGVTPYRSMLKSIDLEQYSQTQFHLMFGARSEQELYYGDEFDQLHHQHPNFHFYPCFSRNPREACLALDRSGYVQKVVEELNPNPDTDIAFLCGNPNMVDAVFSTLKDSGLTAPQIKREKYISPKR
ncbi:MAG: ferredoxin--NADP reductase [bacterium]